MLLVFFAYELSLITLDVLNQHFDVAREAPVETLGTKKNSSLDVDYMSISRLYLFGRATVQHRQSVAEVDLPDTTLKLLLTGVVFNTGQSGSTALVGQSINSQKPYKVGDKLPGNGTLEEIHTDFVVLSRAGKKEKLKLVKKALDKQSVRITTRQESAFDFRNDVTKGRLLAQYKQQLMRDPTSLLGALRVNPVNDKGKLIGYRLNNGKSRSFLKQFGLKNGDVVTSINGGELNPFKAMELLQNLENLNDVDLGVIRNGQPLNFQFSINN